MNWHIALTEPGADRIAAEALRNRCYLVYRPILPIMVRHGRGRLRSVMKSMFPGYLFVIDNQVGSWERLRNAVGVRAFGSLLMINGHLAILENGIIEMIKATEQRLCTETMKREKVNVPFHVGETVRIEDGPFVGLFGNIETLDDMQRICLLMSLFGRESRVFVPLEHLLPA